MLFILCDIDEELLNNDYAFRGLPCILWSRFRVVGCKLKGVCIGSDGVFSYIINGKGEKTDGEDV